MTIKNQRKNISAENQDVLINATLSNGIITFTKKNLYNDVPGSFTIDLKGIKLRIKKKTQAQLDDLKTSTDPLDIEERETHLFLVPLSDHNTEGIYREYIWSEEDEDFEVLGSTQLDLDPIENDIADLKTLIEYDIENNEVKSIRLDTIESVLATKVDKVTGKGLSTNDYTTPEKQKLAGIEAEANKYIHPATHSINEVQGLQNALDDKADTEDLNDYVSISLLNDVLTQMKNDLNN